MPSAGSWTCVFTAAIVRAEPGWVPSGSSSWFPWRVLWSRVSSMVMGGCLSSGWALRSRQAREPFLVRVGMLSRTPRGRVATDRAYDYFQVQRKWRNGNQPPLF